MGGEGRFAAAIIGTPGRDLAAGPRPGDRAGGPAYGIGLVSRLPVTRWLVTRLPSAPVRSPIVIPGPRRKVLWLRDEPRVLIAAVLETPAGPITVANTHLSFVPGWNGAQLRRAARAVRSLPAPRVLLGDLNLPGALPRWLTGWTPLALGADVPDRGAAGAARPRARARAGLPPVGAAGAREMALSDHRALIVDLGDAKTDGMTGEPVRER